MITTRLATEDDAGPMCEIMNPIVEAGTTTAHRNPFDAARMISHYISAPHAISSIVAVEDGALLGFQGIFLTEPAPDGSQARWAEIGSFVGENLQGRGVGQALWQTTLDHARQADIDVIGATIRTDNVPGIAYYSGLGFMDYDVIRGAVLSDGTPVDKICKRYDLAHPL